MTTEQNQDIDSAFLAAQRDFLSAEKSGKNPHLKSTYSTLKDVQAAVYPSLHANGLAVIFGLVWKDAEVIGVECKVFGCGGSISTIVPIQAWQNMQQLGSAISYAKRYGLIAITGLAINDGTDDDGEAAKKGPKSEPRPPRPEKPAKPSVRQTMSAIARADTHERLMKILDWVENNADTSKDHLIQCIEERKDILDKADHDKSWEE